MILRAIASQCDTSMHDLFEVAKRVRFGIVRVEDGQEFRNCEQVLQFLSQAQKFQLAAILVDGCIARYQFTDSARIDVGHAGQIQKYLFLPFFQQPANGTTQSHTAFADGNAAIHVKDRDVSGLSLENIKFCYDSGSAKWFDFLIVDLIVHTILAAQIKNLNLKSKIALSSAPSFRPRAD